MSARSAKISEYCPLDVTCVNVAINSFGRGSNVAIEQVCATPQSSLIHLEVDVPCLASDRRDVTEQGERVRIAAKSRIDRRTR